MAAQRDKSKLYIAYGSNTNPNQMAIRCPEAIFIGLTEIQNYKLVYRLKYLTIIPYEGIHVTCALWDITQFDEEWLNNSKLFTL